MKQKYRKLVAKEYGEEDDLSEEDQEEVQETLAENDELVDRLIQQQPKREPGAWVFVLKEVITELKLGLSLRLPINQRYKHFNAWTPYRKLLEKRLTPAAVACLKLIEEGRPLQGKDLELDGWLTADEVAELSASVSQLQTSDVTNPDLHEFQGNLVESLQILTKQQAALFLSAHQARPGRTPALHVFNLDRNKIRTRV